MTHKSGRIVKNTMYLYIRMFLLMFVSLYSSRVLLEVLGVTDLGIYNVVGSVVLMLEFVSSSLTNSSQRYLSIALGRDDLILGRKYFSQSFGIHLLFSLLVVLLLETGGLWLVNNKLTIPVDRIDAVHWVYQFSVLAAFIKINQVCFQSVIVARENMSVYAYLSIFEAIIKLMILYWLLYMPSVDQLVAYAFLILMVQFLVFSFHVIICYLKYNESRYFLFWDKSLSKEMLSFISINVFGSMSWALGVQGINIVLNIFFGPTVNAARGLAATVGRFINQLVNNVYLAIKPQLIKSYAANEVEEMLILAERSTTYIYYLVLLLTVPLLRETEFVLKVWLKEVPEYTVTFARLVILQSYFWMLPIPFSQIATATGDIKNIQLFGRIFTLLSLPISYVILKFVPNPYYPIFIIICMDALYWLYTVYEINKQLDFGLRRYLVNVIRPISRVSFSVFLFSFALYMLGVGGNSGWSGFLLNSTISILVVLVFVFWFGLSSSDIKQLKLIVLAKWRN
ncbi:hypothetical protein LAG90_14805 [Marinilongibacter aquaticus]|uniref:hypothetical protein n=1 Tax=Marinilongibacter aquaticus TaxID=2975157 RepID=UPI0021BDC976|nr:hypothetical protein [Marinilongibacter aquaticus]UBM58074.1 hypothetical protein LAG90_14805 [Marinilongibacter aquaticus]